ncbi:hypothetical protein ISN44_As08g038220 [Arabidopsis suecica]|uniref:Uncharacterized protein n=1 Tax=Arabidopsis suecica TaxID=45249 RepID=A0A8T2BGT3_ARASU|nr:hypothetical protein ISN44_As08g038220 [Arabidopsis suecica]
MADQPVTKVDFEGFASTITTTLTTALTALTNQMTLLTTEIRNGNNNTNQQRGRREKSTKDLQSGIDFEHQMQVLINKIKYQQKTREEALRVPRGENNRVEIDENTSSNEESMKKEIGQENLHNNYDSHMDAKEELVKDEIVDQENKQSNHVKTDILLFYGISEVDEMLITPEEKLVVQRNLKTLIAHEHEKHYNEENPRRKKSRVLVMIHYKKRLDANFKKTNGLISVVKKKTTIPEDLLKILTNLRELDSDGYLHDFPPMRDKADEILYSEENLRTSSSEVEETDVGEI